MNFNTLLFDMELNFRTFFEFITGSSRFGKTFAK